MRWPGVLLALLFQSVLGMGVYAIVVRLGTPPLEALAVPVALFVIAYATGPSVVRRLYAARAVPRSHFGPEVEALLLAYQEREKVRHPGLLLIQDPTPNALSFGWTRRFSHVAVTEGLVQRLTPAELRAVIAHELGHVRSVDVVLLTYLAAIPTWAYIQFHKLAAAASGKWIRPRGWDQTKRGRLDVGPVSVAVGHAADHTNAAAGRGAPAHPVAAVVLLAIASLLYLLYALGQLNLLFVSRGRERAADAYAASLTSPRDVAAALLKVLHAQGRSGHATTDEPEPWVARHHSALMFVDAHDAPLLPSTPDGAIDEAQVPATLAWELWNPWARAYELGSAHPLPARRLAALSRLAKESGDAEIVRFPERAPESYVDDMARDVLASSLWVLLPAAALGWHAWSQRALFAERTALFVGAGLAAAAYLLGVTFLSGAAPRIVRKALAALHLGVAILLAAVIGGQALLAAVGIAVAAGVLGRALFMEGWRHPPLFRPAQARDAMVSAKLSPVRGTAVELTGDLFARPTPDGAVVTFRDASGELPVAERRRSDIAHALASGVVVRGWVRRAPRPYLEVSHAVVGGHKWYAHKAAGRRVAVLAMLAGGGLLFWYAAPVHAALADAYVAVRGVADFAQAFAARVSSAGF